MDNPQDCLVTSSQDIIKKSSPSSAGHSASLYQNRHGRKKKIKSASEQFPWFLDFQKLCRSVLGSNSIKDLLNVISVYTDHVSQDVAASYSKPNRAAKLKTNIISVLGFFHNSYITMKEPFDEAVYLEKMANLLTMYFDMEVKASRRGKESVKKITSKLISALFIILNNSAEYILDTILKARFTVKCYSEIWIPIFKMVTQLPLTQEMNYVRCLLVFKLWKRMLPCQEERNSINRLAVAKLSPPPAQVMEFIKRGLLANVLPTPPEDKGASLVTRFFMTKKFNLKESIKAFFKMEAEMKLNDFTAALDSIRFLDDGDVVPEENSFEKDYSLLESIWIDISNSPEHTELSTPSSGISPLDATLSGTSHVLELSKTTTKKAKRSLFKPKTPKKNKIKSKSNTNKTKEELVIDLCKEIEDNCPDIFENVQSSSETKTDEVCEKISPSSSAADNSSNFESDASFLSDNISEVNSSLDSKLEREFLENDFTKKKIKVDSEPVINKYPKSESSFMSKSKCLESAPKPQVIDIHSALENEDFSAEIPPQNPTNEDIDSKNNFNSDSKFNEMSDVKVNRNENLKVKPESNDDVVSVTNEIKIVEEKNEGQISTIENQSNLLTTHVDVAEKEPPVNKIVISCKNFSKIGFKNEEVEEELVKRLNEEVSEDLISTIEINEDPILKSETLKEDTLLLKDDDIPSERLSFELIDHSFNDEELSWDNRLDVNCSDIGTSKLSSTEIENLSKDISGNSCNSTKFNFDTELTHGTKTDSFDLFLDKTNNINKRTSKTRVGGVDKVLSQVVFNSEDDSTNSLVGQMFQMQDYLQETNKNVHMNISMDNKTVTENDSQDGDSIGNSVYKSPQTHKTISDITGVDLKSGTKMVHKSISTIIHELKENATSSDSSNQESSEVSSSSFDDNFQIKNDNFSKLNINPFVERHDSTSCKVENQNFKEFSTCMQTSTHKTSKPLQKCVENIQVPLEKSSYISNKANFSENSQSSSLPKNENDSQNQSLKLHKGLNTCLLHKILGEEDCLKSGCLLKNPIAEKNRKDLNKAGFSDVSLKQELENSSELPSDSSTPTISTLWNPTAGIKVEKDHENNGSFERVEGIRNTSSEFLIRSVTEACNFKELDYNIGGNECDTLTTSYDCESDCEDRNLVIDEDVESFKDHTETEDSPLKHKSVSVQSDERSPVILTISNNNTMDKKLWNKNILSVANDSQEQTSKTTHVQTKENDALKKEMAGKHKLPRIIESNVKTSSLRNPYTNEDLSVRYQPQNSEVLVTSESCTQFISTQHYGEGIPGVDPKHYTQTTFSKQTEGNFNVSQTPSSHRVLSPYPTVHHNINPNIIRTKNRDPRLGPVSDRTTVSPHPNVNIPPMKVNSLESVGPVNQLSLSPDIVKANSPRLVASPGHYDTLTQYNVGSKMSVRNNRSSNSPVEQYSQSIRQRNEKFRSLETQNREPPINKFKENSNLVSYSNLATFVDGSNIKDNSNSSLIKFGAADSQKMKVGEPYDFNVFPIAQEIEICSGSENLGGEWLYPSSSEIGHPDWPIANEQNVIDSSNYPQTPEQFMYSLLKSDDGSSMPEPDQTCYIPLELQQIDNRHPNIVGKNVNKDELSLHLRTLECDYNLSCSQSEFKEFYLSRDIPPTIPVPFPPQARTDNSTHSTVRCPCEQCSDNHQKLLSNYNILTHFRNSKIKPTSGYSRLDEASFSDKEQNGEFDCSLPLKKRKTLTNSKSSDELVLPSYPNTPMISIAQLELTGYDQGNQVIVPNPQSQWSDAIAFNPLNLVQPSTIEQYDAQTKGKRRSSKRRKSSR